MHPASNTTRCGCPSQFIAFTSMKGQGFAISVVTLPASSTIYSQYTKNNQMRHKGILLFKNTQMLYSKLIQVQIVRQLRLSLFLKQFQLNRNTVIIDIKTMNHPDKQNINIYNLPVQPTKQKLISFYQLKNSKKLYPQTSQFNIPDRQLGWQQRVMAISDRQKAVQNKLSSLLNNQRRQFSQAQILVQERFKKLKIVKENQRKQQIDQKNLKLAEFNVNSHKQQQSNSINQIQILKSGQPTNLNSLNNSFNLQASTGSTLKQYLYEKSVRQDQNQVHDTLNQILKLACMLNKQNAPAFQEKEMNQLQALNFIKKLLVSYLLSLQAEQVNQSSDQIDG